MSAGDYVLNIKLKDPQGLFAQIKNLEQNGIGGKVNAASGGGGGFFSKKLGDMNLGMLAKLSGIGFGIHQLVQLGIKSSGILQGTMKMWESSIMLMIKPIADFIGLMLRPVTVLMLTQFIIPFYKTVYPWFRDAGKAAGGILAQGFMPEQTGHKPLIADLSFDNLKVQFTAIGLSIGLAFDALYTSLTTTFGSIPGILFSFFVNVGTAIWTSLSAIPGVLFSLLVNIGTSIWTSLSNIPGILFGLLVNIGESIWNGLLGVPGLIVGVFTGLGEALVSALANIPQMIWNAIIGWIPGLGNGGTTPSGTSRWAGRAAARTTSAAIADTV